MEKIFSACGGSSDYRLNIIVLLNIDSGWPNLILDFYIIRRWSGDKALLTLIIFNIPTRLDTITHALTTHWVLFYGPKLIACWQIGHVSWANKTGAAWVQNQAWGHSARRPQVCPHHFPRSEQNFHVLTNLYVTCKKFILK